MNRSYLQPKRLTVLLYCLVMISIHSSEKTFAAAATGEEKIFHFDDQYILIETVKLAGESRSSTGVEIRMTPKPGWKLLADNSSAIKPLRIKFSPSKCMKLKGVTNYSQPDQSGMDDSGSYSEYFTRTAYIRQEFARVKCKDKDEKDVQATLVYLLCQDSRCVGPFSRELRLKANP